MWTNYYSDHFVLFVALAVLQSHRDVLLRYLTEFDEVLKYANDLSGTVSLPLTVSRHSDSSARRSTCKQLWPKPKSSSSRSATSLKTWTKKKPSLLQLVPPCLGRSARMGRLLRD